MTSPVREQLHEIYFNHYRIAAELDALFSASLDLTFKGEL